MKQGKDGRKKKKKKNLNENRVPEGKILCKYITIHFVTMKKNNVWFVVVIFLFPGKALQVLSFKSNFFFFD